MQINTSMVASSSKFELLEEGVWEADITRMYDDEERAYLPKPGDPLTRPGLRLEFTLVEGNMRGKKFSKFVGPAVNPRTHLWGLLKSILKREILPEDLAKCNTTEELIDQMGGHQVKLIIQNTTSAKGNEYSKLTGFMKSTRTEATFPFEAGAPDGTEQVEQPPAQPVPAVSDTEEMEKVAEEVFGADAPDNPPVAKATAKKVV
jgi:hypothetical protein